MDLGPSRLRDRPKPIEFAPCQFDIRDRRLARLTPSISLVAASLRNVDDPATEAKMQRFYECPWRQGGPLTNEALRRAQAVAP